MLAGYKTIIAASIAIVAAALQLFGIEWSIADQEAMGNALVVVVSGLAALRFRITATKSFVNVDGKLE